MRSGKIRKRMLVADRFQRCQCLGEPRDQLGCCIKLAISQAGARI